MLSGLQFLETRERFLPVKPAAMCARMLADRRLRVEEREQLGKLFEMIAARFHFEFRSKLERLKMLYEPFDPDAETAVATEVTASEAAQRQELGRGLEELLLAANYVEMPREQVIAWVNYQSQSGLVVESSLSDYAELQVFYRGVGHQERTFRPWRTPWRWQSETVHVFSRVVVVVRLAREPSRPVFLKLFKNVVAEDLEMLLPYVRIRMRLLDHLKIGSSVAGGAATAGWKALTAAFLSWWFVLLIVAGFITASIRSVFSFFSSKTRYMHVLTANLYFQNLANNSSALAHLVDTAEAEECKELLLAYYILYVERERDYTQAQLEQRIEQWLRAELDVEVDFEVVDALRKLREKQLLICRPAGVLKVHDLPTTLRKLDEVWDGYF